MKYRWGYFSEIEHPVCPAPSVITRKTLCRGTLICECVLPDICGQMPSQGEGHCRDEITVSIKVLLQDYILSGNWLSVELMCRLCSWTRDSQFASLAWNPLKVTRCWIFYMNIPQNRSSSCAGSGRKTMLCFGTTESHSTTPPPITCLTPELCIEPLSWATDLIDKIHRYWWPFWTSHFSRLSVLLIRSVVLVRNVGQALSCLHREAVSRVNSPTGGRVLHSAV